MKKVSDFFKYIWHALQSVFHSIGTLTFLRALTKNPKAIGAVLPSSRRLANEMASHVKLSQDGLVIELGAGTGVITEAVLKMGVHPEQIIAVEYTASLAKDLRRRFPDILVIEGNAANLTALLGEKSKRVDTIISGLPLRSLPEDTVSSVLSEISSILSGGGKYIQFTYHIRSDASYYPEHFRLEHTKVIWGNIPPAKVEVFVL